MTSGMTKVLLADDDAELVELLTQYLEREGFDVTAVGDGEGHRVLAGDTSSHDLRVVAGEVGVRIGKVVVERRWNHEQTRSQIAEHRCTCSRERRVDE